MARYKMAQNHGKRIPLEPQTLLKQSFGLDWLPSGQLTDRQIQKPSGLSFYGNYLRQISLAASAQCGIAQAGPTDGTALH